MVRSIQHSVAKRSGLAAVELALLAPLLCFLFVITIDYARIFHHSLTVTNCARNGAVFGCLKPANALDKTGIEAAAKKDAGTLNPELMTVTATPNNDTSPTSLSVTVTYPFSTITSYVGIPSSVTVSKTSKVNVSPLTPN